MKKFWGILILFVLLLIQAPAYADTWIQYFLAQGDYVSGAAIMKDDGNLNSQWVYKGGYRSVTNNIQTFALKWVESSKWVPPVTEQQEIIMEGYVQYAINANFMYRYADLNIQQYGWSGACFDGNINDTTKELVYELRKDLVNIVPDPDNPGLYMAVYKDTNVRVTTNDLSYSGTDIRKYMGTYKYTDIEYSVPPFIDIISYGGYLPRGSGNTISYGPMYVMAYPALNTPFAQNEGLAPVKYFDATIPKGSVILFKNSGSSYASVAFIPVKIHTHQYQTVTVIPGHYEDTSHYETTIINGTETHLEYTESPHWSEPSAMIPVYADTGN